MTRRVEWREPDDLWRGRQPSYETLVMSGRNRFALTTRLPSGERIDVPIGRLSLDMRPPRPSPEDP
jgi:hypothetical protein